MDDARERPWRDNPHLSEGQKAALDRLYELWLEGGRQPVLIENIEVPESLKGLYRDINISQSPPLWTVSQHETTETPDEDA